MSIERNLPQRRTHLVGNRRFDLWVISNNRRCKMLRSWSNLRGVGGNNLNTTLLRLNTLNGKARSEECAYKFSKSLYLHSL